jgi:hypothetical protein
MHPRDSDNYELTGKERILAIERGSTRSPSVENSLWKMLWTYRKRGNRILEEI